MKKLKILKFIEDWVLRIDHSLVNWLLKISKLLRSLSIRKFIENWMLKVENYKLPLFILTIFITLLGIGIYKSFYPPKHTIGRPQGIRWIDTQAKEVKGLRNQEIVKADARSTHFKNKDGSITAYITEFDQNSQDEDGNWQPIDYSLKKIRDKEYDYQTNFGTDFKISKYGAISNQALGITTTDIEIGGFNFSENPFTPQKYKVYRSKIQDTTLKSKSKYFDLHVDVTDQSIKQEIIIKNKTFVENIDSEYIALKSTFSTQNIIMLNDSRMSSGIHSITKEDRAYTTDSSQNIIATLPFPESWDKDETDIETLRYVNNLDFQNMEVYTLVKKSSLLASDIKYPITIDPDFEGDSTDGYVNHYGTNYAQVRGSSPTNKAQGTSVLRIGQSYSAATYNIWRSLMKFDTSSIGATSIVTANNMKITMQGVTYLSTHFTPRITNYDWEADGPITDGNNITLFAGVHSGSVLASFASTSGWTVNTTKTSGSISTSTVDTTGYTLYGLQGSRDRDSNTPVARNWVDYYQSGTGTASYRPVLVVTYTTPEIKGLGGDVNYDKNRTKDDGADTLDTAYKELTADEYTVGLWHLNESYGDEYAYDSSGFSNDMALNNTESADWKSGIANNAIELDGTNEYLNTGDIDAIDGASQVTFEAWIYKTGANSYDGIITKSDATSGFDFLLAGGLGGTDDLFFRVASGNYGYTTSDLINTDEWHHVAAVFDGSTTGNANRMKIYIDGVEQEITFVGTIPTVTSTTSTEVRLGYYQAGADYFAGKIDEIRISNIARTPEEIIASASRYPYSTYTSPILNTGGAVKSWKDFSWTENGVNTGDGETVFDSTGLVAQWNFNETSGTTANNDAEGTSCGGTPANCDGTLSGFDSTVSQDADPDSGWTAANRRWGAGALQFDGSDSYINAGTNASLDLASGTVAVWIRPKDDDGEVLNSIVAKDVGGTNDGDFNLFVNKTYNATYPDHIGLIISDASTLYDVYSNQPIEFGKWHHVVVTFGSGGKKMYINGKLQADIDVETTGMENTTPNLTFGAMSTGSSFFYKGVMDAPQIYSAQLSDSEILSLYNKSNIQFETRVGGTSTPDSSWEDWKPTTNSTQINSFDADSSNWQIDGLAAAPESSLGISDESNIKQEDTGSLKLENSYVDNTDVNLVSYWNLDETNGDNGGNDIFDGTSNNNHCEMYGTNIATAVVDGIVGKARNFNGTNDYLSCGLTNIPTNSFTFSAWFTTNSTHEIDAENTTGTGGTSGENYLFFPSNHDTNSGAGVSVGTNGISVYEHASGYMPAIAVYSGTIPSGWNHVAIVYESKQPSIFLNGVLVHVGLTSPKTSVTAPTFVGGSSVYGWHDGYIDEAQVSSVAHTPEEIAETYKMGANHHINKTLSSTDLSDDNMIAFDIAADKPGTYLETIIGESDYANYQTDANTVGLWHLNEHTDDACNTDSDDACDSSGNGNHLDEVSTPPIVQGKMGKARDFSNGVDYLTCTDANCGGTSTGLDFGVSATFSYEAWMSTTSTASYDAVMGKKGSTGATGAGYTMYFNTDGTISCAVSDDTLSTTSNSTSSINDGEWHYVACVVDGSNLHIYVNGILEKTTTNSVTGSYDNALDFRVGLFGNGFNPHEGSIDEVRVDSTARTTTQIRQAYEIGRRSHPITIDFAASLGSGNLITDSSDLSFDIDATAYGLPEKGSMLFENDKLIVKENVDGTEYIAQGTVTDIQHSGGYVRVLSWNTESTFPTGGFTANATVFKWQREYFDLNDVSLDDHIDAATELTFRVTNGHEGRTVYIDDLTSEGDIMTTSTGSTISSNTGQRYYQYRTIFSNADEFVSADVTDISVDYVTPEPDLNMNFDENYGSTAYDSSRQSNNGVITNALWKDSGECLNRSCLEFDGTGDYIAITDNDTLDPTEEITLTAWIKPQTVTVTGNIVSKTNSSYRFRTIAASAGLFGIQFLDRGGTNYISSTAPYPALDEWHHIAVVGDSSGLKIYIDGNLNTSNATSYGGTADSNNLHIGCYNASNTECFDGFMDGVKMYRYARTAEEIKTDYNSLAAKKGAVADFGHYQSQDTSPVGYWPMDENTGTITTYDRSGNGNDGTLTSMTEDSWVSGKFGSALEFDGSADYIDITNSTDFDIVNPTIEAWVYSDDFDQNMFIFEKGPVNTQYSCFFQGTNIIFRTYNTTPTADDLTTDSSDAGVSPNQWNHIACVYDGSNKIIYVNGVQAASKAYTQTLQTGQSGQRIGAYGGTPSYFFDGKIDEVRVYDYARTSSQIIQDMNGSHPIGGSPVASQVGYWSFDEMSGTTANDRGTGGNSGTLTNSPTWKSKESCKINGCINFNGTNNYISIIDDDSIDIGDKFTTTGWFNVNDTAATRSIIYKANEYLIRVESDDKFNFFLHDGTDYEPRLTAPTNPSASEWHHFAAVYDSTLGSNHQKLYLDGVLVAEQDRSITTTATTNHLYFGIAAGTYFDGELDEIKMYSTALTADEIKIDMNAGSSSTLGGVRGNSEKSTLTDGAGSYPVGWWKFDENTGTTTTYDSSGSGNDGTLTSITEAAWKKGKKGSALEFDGIADYVNLGDNLDPTGSFTINTFVNLDVISGARCIVCKWDNPNYGFLFRTNGDRLQFYVRNSTNTGSTDIITDTLTLNTDEWYNVSAIYDADNLEMKIYVNGIEQDTTLTGTVPSGVNNTTEALKIGWADTTYFDGKIDEVKIYDYALTQSQIAYEYNRGKPIAWYRLDECTGTSAYDASGNAYHGTITIGATGTNTSAGTCTGSAGEAWKDGATGKFNSSLEFDGTDDYVSLSSDNLPTEDFTYAVWINPDTVTSNDNVLHVNNSSGGTELQIRIRDTSQLQVDVDGTSTSTTNTLTGKVGEWVHLAITRKGSVITSYIDGLADPTTGSDGDILDFTSCPFYFGLDVDSGCSGSLGNYFYGQIDDVRVYNYALSATQIKSIINYGAIRFE